MFSWRRLLLWRGWLCCCLVSRGQDRTCCGAWNDTSITWTSAQLCLFLVSPWKDLERTPHRPSCQDIFSLFLKAILRMCWHSQKAERAPTCGRNPPLQILSWNPPTKDMNVDELFLRGASPFLLWCFMVPWLSRGNVPERGQGRKEMPFWLKGREKKDDLLSLGFVYHTQDTPRPFSRGIFFLLKFSSVWNQLIHQRAWKQEFQVCFEL